MRAPPFPATAVTSATAEPRADIVARAEIEDQRRFIEAVVGAAGVLVLVLDEQGRFVRFNGECERASGWRADEVLGRCPWDTVLPPEAAETVRGEAFGAAMAAAQPGAATHYTNEWLARDGSRRLIEWTNTLLLDTGGAARFMVSIGIDITARRASEQRLHRAQRVAQLGTWELDLVTGRLDWSDEIYRIFEIDPTRAVASYEAFLATVHPDDRGLVDAAYSNSLVTREPYRIEHRLKVADGRIKWVEERGESDFDSHGKPLRSLGTVQDVTERHQRDAELHKFRHIVEQGSQEVWLTDAGQRVRYANAAAGASLGYAPEELVGKRLADIDAGGEAGVDAVMRRTREQTAAGVGPLAVEIEHRARDGRLVPKDLWSTSVVIDSEVLRCSFAMDISARRQAQAALAASRAQLMATLNIYPGWVACADDDLRYLFVNQQFARDLGRPMAEIIGRTVEELRGAALAAELSAVNRRLLAGERVEVERRQRDADGHERVCWIHYRVAPDAADPGRHVFYAFGTDITEARRTQLELNTVVDATHIGTWEWHPKTDQLRINAQLPMLAGYAPDELPAAPRDWLNALVHPDDLPARSAPLARVLAGEADAFDCEYRVRHKQGHWIWLLDRARVVARDAEGRPAQVIGTTQDISALKRQELALQRLNAELEQRVEQRTRELAAAKALAERASAAKTEFLSRMSHELRTPLNAIMGFGQLLELASLQAREAQHVHEVMRAGHHLLDLINEVLDLATVESGRIELALEPVALRALATECAALMRPAAQQAGLHLEARMHDTCHPVMADRGRLRQVLLNLLSNAVKYNRPGGRIVVDCECGAAGLCELRVTDTGAGLTPSQIERLFQPFERLEAKHTGIQGTGIGLSVSKRLVELMGGQIGVTSRPGEGSTFWLRLPAATSQAALQAGDGPAPPALPETAPESGPMYRLLYVEDNLANQRLMQHLLGRRRDLELITTADPRSAVELAQRRQPALILLDIQLPHLDGYQVLARLRAAGIGVPIVAVSANAMPSDVERGMKAGFADYLTKPLDVRRVLEVVAALLPAQAGAGPT